jgi:Bacterial Ig-like domain (group 2)
MTRVFLLITLVTLIACSTPVDLNTNDQTQGFATSSELTEISGTLTGWDRGAQKVRAGFYVGGSINDVFASQDVSANGSFKLPLPTNIDATKLYDFPGLGCPAVKVTPGLRSALMTSLGVELAPGRYLGILTYANADIPIVSQQPLVTGTTLVFWIYANQSGSINGPCPSQNLTSTYDMDIKAGWNSIIVEYTGPQSVLYRTGKTSNKLTWRFIPSPPKLSLDTDNVKLEIGQTHQFKLTAQASDGSVSNLKPVWTSTKPLIATINGDGLVTAKGFGQTEIRASLNGQTVSSMVSTFGLRTVGGTFTTVGQGQKGTAFQMRYVNANGSNFNAVAFKVRINGPNGWNNNQSFETTYPASAAWHWFTVDIAPISGTYTISQDNGSSDSITIDATGSVTPVENVQVTETTTYGTTMTFTSNSVAIYARTFDVNTGQYVGLRDFCLPGRFFAFGDPLDFTHQNELHILTTTPTPVDENSLQEFHVARVKVPISLKPASNP